MILGIETSTDVCSVAFENREGETFEKRIESRGSHSEKLFLFIRDLMKEHSFIISDLSVLLVSEGPGSYTGLRIAASGIKGLLFRSDVPLIAVPTMASLACGAIGEEGRDTAIHAVIDARRVHVYHQRFTVKGGILRSGRDVEVIPIASFEKMVQPGDVIIGTGLQRLAGSVKEKATLLGNKYITARSLIALYRRDKGMNFIRERTPEEFDPRYYTSNQVQS